VCQRLVLALPGRVPPLGWAGLAHGVVELAEEPGPFEPAAFARALRDVGASAVERFAIAAALSQDLDTRFVGAWQLLGGRVDCVRPRLTTLLQLAQPAERDHLLALSDPRHWLRATGLLRGGDTLDEPLGAHPAWLGRDGDAAALGVIVEGDRIALPPGRRLGARTATAFIIEGPLGSGRATRAKELAGGGTAYVRLDARGPAQLAAVIRTAVLRGVAPVIDLGDVSHDAFASLLDQLVEYAGPLFLIAEARPLLPAPWQTRVAVCTRPDVPTRARLWREAGVDEQADELARRFPLGHGAIGRAAAEARYRGLDGHSLAQAAREQLETRSLLAERIRTTRTLSDLVAPAATTALIAEIIEFARHRREVFEDWGFNKRQRGGLKVLFSGPPGTGKTMSAEIIAAELDLDLFRIDLSNIVSKWIGETEKNLKQVFDHAETNGGVLLFDEADSLFGKRTNNVQSATDRYANMEINYLLQRMEAFEGVCLLTTNIESGMDEAFKRRLNFRVRFSTPDAHERAELWRLMIPAQAPRGGELDFDEVADRFELTGGNIRNAAVRAAVLAAAEGHSLETRHLLDAASREYGELGRV
jgi:AAA+ superfamily predicted ATPase